METEIGKTTIGQTEQEKTGAGLEEQARKKAQSLKEEAVDRGRKFIEERKGTAAEFIKDVADAMETAAEQLESRDRKTAGWYIRSASREMQRWSSSLREYGVDRIAQQVQTFAGRHPGMLLGGAAVAGFAVTRVFRSVERPRESVAREQATRPETAAAPTEQPYRPPQEGYRSPPAEEFGPHS